MSFFAAAEGITAPGLQGAGVAAGGGQEPGIEDAEDAEDWWKCLVRFDPDTGKTELYICCREGKGRIMTLAITIVHSRTMLSWPGLPPVRFLYP